MDLQITKLELIGMLLKTEKTCVLEKVKNLLLEEQKEENNNEVDYAMIDKRRESHLKEESASYSWKEVKEKVRAAKL